MKLFAAAALALLAGCMPALAASSGTTPLGAISPSAYRHLRAAIYVTVNDTRKLADPAVFAREYRRVTSQLHFDKVYIEVYRDHVFATDAQIEAVKKAFSAHGIAVAGGITLAAGGSHGQFGTFDYEKAADRAECERAARLAARHFNHVILDDFFFYNGKSPADIAAKGARSWTQYRLDTMREVSRDLVLAPARAVNPHVQMIIKYPNWYPHFQGLGYDLEKESHNFDAIYTGTETRDPILTDQLLQQYQSYGIVRYYDHIRPGHNLGGWVDTFSTRSIDRYAEQLWDTLFAKAPEITLFNWHPMASTDAASAGKRPWHGSGNTFAWDAATRAWSKHHAGQPGWALAANVALHQADAVLGQLGHPQGMAMYRPYQSSGEDFLENYLGNIGWPIEMTPHFPRHAPTVLLTQAAAHDPRIVSKMEAALQRGQDLVVTSGLVEALHGHGFADIAEWTPTGNVIGIRHYVDGYGAGNGDSLDGDATPPRVLFPAIRFYTNDSWAIVRGVASARGFPLLLMDHYANGTIYMLTVPENEGDLYRIPQPALTRIKAYLLDGQWAVLAAPAKVSLFLYDNRTLVVENYRARAARVRLLVKGHVTRLRALGQGSDLGPSANDVVSVPGGVRRTAFRTSIPAHSFRVYRIAD